MIISLNSISLSGFITEAESVCSAVRTGSLNATDPGRPLKSYLSHFFLFSTIYFDYT